MDEWHLQVYSGAGLFIGFLLVCAWGIWDTRRCERYEKRIRDLERQLGIPPKIDWTKLPLYKAE